MYIKQAWIHLDETVIWDRLISETWNLLGATDGWSSCWLTAEMWRSTVEANKRKMWLIIYTLCPCFPLPAFLFLLFMKVCLSLSLHDHVSPSTGDRRHLLCSLAVIIRSKTHWLTHRQTFGREEKRSTERVRWFKRDGIRKLQTLSRARFHVRGSREKDVLRILIQLNALQPSLCHLVHLQAVTAHTTAGQHQNHGRLVALHPCVVASTSMCVHCCAQPATQL